MKTRIVLILITLLCAAMATVQSARAAIVLVTNANDNGPGSLRQALVDASDGDTIDVTGVSGTILLTSGELQITHTVTINGPRAGNLAINGNATFGVLEAFFPSDATISRFTITNGASGIFTHASTLTVNNCTISGNSATGNGGSIYNSHQGQFGSIYNRQPGPTTELDLGNTILSAGVSGENIFNDAGTVTSHGYNLSSDNGGGYLIGPGDQINTDPMLGPLQDNGGPTFTHALLPGSAAIDAGDPKFTPPPFYDQRGLGFNRVVNGRIDIGSLEVQAGLTPTPTPTSTATATPTATTIPRPSPTVPPRPTPAPRP